jgi:serine kinase of HPr protein (carbohydrate metabolism regulator)
MLLKSVIDKLDLELVTRGVDVHDREVRWAYTSDLLSDVMAGATAGDLWLTIQRHLNIVAVAKLNDLGGIVLAKGIVPSPEVLDKAEKEGIPILVSKLPLFELSGVLYELLRGEDGS